MLFRRIDPQDDELLLFHSTRPSEQSLKDGWLNCHTLLGKPKFGACWGPGAHHCIGQQPQQRSAYVHLGIGRRPDNWFRGGS